MGLGLRQDARHSPAKGCWTDLGGWPVPTPTPRRRLAGFLGLSSPSTPALAGLLHQAQRLDLHAALDPRDPALDPL